MHARAAWRCRTPRPTYAEIGWLADPWRLSLLQFRSSPRKRGPRATGTGACGPGFQLSRERTDVSVCGVHGLAGDHVEVLPTAHERIGLQAQTAVAGAFPGLDVVLVAMPGAHEMRLLGGEG